MVRTEPVITYESWTLDFQRQLPTVKVGGEAVL